MTNHHRGETNRQQDQMDAASLRALQAPELHDLTELLEAKRWMFSLVRSGFKRVASTYVLFTGRTLPGLADTTLITQARNMEQESA
jgi:hypothetical protein